MPCVYILTNPTIPGLVKIGSTDGNPADRAAQISSQAGTGLPRPFAVEWSIETTTRESAYSVERAVHKALANHRINKNREFFKITVAQAVDKIEDLAYQMQATSDSAIRHAIEEAERIKRAQAIQREAAERYQREAPQREAAERARREAAELARVERVRAEAEQAEQNAAIRAQREAAARIEAARISRNKKMVWGSLVLVACFLFGAYEDNKRQKEQERYARSEQARAEQAERYAAIRAKREAAERARTEKARADALRIEQACAPINVRATSPRPITSLTTATTTTTRFSTNYSGLAGDLAAIDQPVKDALLASQQRRQQMEACNQALFLASQNR